MIYVDMDGVIADFEGWIKTFIPDITEEDWKNTRKPWVVLEENYMTAYRDLQPLDLISHFNNLYNNVENVVFLTALPSGWYETEKWEIGCHNKRAWLADHIDNFRFNDVIFTKTAREKIDYVKPRHVLYDDREDTLKHWRDNGGIGIHVKGRRINQA